MRSSAMYPGTFDPMTRGHEDIVRRAATIFSKVLIAIASNPNKKPMFDVEERCALARVVLADLDDESGRKHAAELGGHFIHTDVTSPADVRGLFEQTQELLGSVDILFNNAGIAGQIGLITDQPENNFDEVFSVNVKGLFIALQQEIRQMLRQGFGGSIVNMASVGGSLATAGASVYVASKHAVLGKTKSGVDVATMIRSMVCGSMPAASIA